MGRLCTRLYILSSFAFYSIASADAQTILNPSFEGDPRESIPPSNWAGCHEFSTPDTQPGFWEVTKNASNGSSYIGLVTRGNLGPFANQNEDVQTRLSSPIAIGESFEFVIDLAFSPNWGHTIDFGSTFLTYDTPAKLQLFGGSTSCDEAELLWESPAIDHTDWRSYEVTLNPQVTEVEYIILQASHTNATTYFGNLLIDNIVECSFEINWVEEITICEHEPLILDVAIPNGTYEWQDGFGGPVFIVDSPGTYSVTVSNGCISKDYEVVVATRNCFCDDAIPIQTVPFDSTKCTDSEILLDAGTPGGFYTWNTGSNASSITVSEPGLYSVEISNRCELQMFDYLIETFECTCEISAPNVFTPNGDGVNEKFEIVGTADLTTYSLNVVDRAGRIVFTTDNINDFWDGTLNGNELSNGVYYYSIKLLCTQEGETKENFYKGWVTLMR